MNEDYQVIWRWRSFLWPFYVCRCDEHESDPHLVYDGWSPFFLLRYKPEWTMSVIYRWIVRVGPLEVRRWIPEQDQAAALAAHNEATR